MCPCHDNYPDDEDENELILTAIDQNDLIPEEMTGVISDDDFTLMPDEVSVSARDVTSNEVAYHDREVSIDGDTFHTFTKNTWVGDTGASCDMCHDDTMLFDVTDISEPIQGFSGVMTATKKGKMRCLARQVDGSTTELLRTNVKFCPNSSVNLFSMTESMSQGSKIESDDAKNLRVINGDTTVTFDRHIKTRDGWVAGVDIIPIPNDCADNATDEVPSESDEKKKKQKTYDINAYHNALGHPSEATTRATANARDIKLVGKFEPCEACMVGKTRQSNLTKTPSQKATQNAERFFLDISSPTQPSLGGKRHWLLVLDDKPDKAWSFFLKQKSDLKDVVLPFLKDITATYGYKIVNIRCDNAGENTALEKLCKQEGLGITFEYTAPGTPQQNGRLERKFATLYGRVRAMLKGLMLMNFGVISSGLKLHKRLLA